MPYKAYQVKTIELLRAFRVIAIKMLREREASSIIKESYVAY
jgi:hypothetical protein